MQKKRIFGFLLLFFIGLNSLIILGLSSEIQYPNNLINYWNFDEGTVNIPDHVGDVNLTLDGCLYEPSRNGTALAFDGINDFATGDSMILENFTIMAWVNWNNISDLSVQTIISQCGDDPTHSKGYALDVESLWPYTDYYLIFWIYDGSWKTISYSVENFTANTWYCITAVYNGTGIQLWVNGVMVDDRNDIGTFQNSPEKLCIGCLYDFAKSGFLNGSIDEIAIFNESLTADTISEYYSEGIPAEIIPDETILPFTFLGLSLLDMILMLIIVIMTIALIITMRSKTMKKTKIPKRMRK